MQAGLAAGKLSVRFRGHKLKGSWALVRTNRVESGREQWLMLQHRDEAACAQQHRVRSVPDAHQPTPRALATTVPSQTVARSQP